VAAADGPTVGDVFQDFANVFNTIGAVAACFGPGPGEIVAIIAAIVAQIFSFLGGLFGLSCPVCDALKDLEKDMVARIQQAKNTVDEIRSRMEKGILADILDNQGVPLQRLNDLYSEMVEASGQYGEYELGPSDGPSVEPDLDNNPAQQQFVESVGTVSAYIESWHTMVDCLSGENIDCVLDGKTALQILAYDGKNWYRPVSLTAAVQYYMQLLSQSAFAICSYDMLANGNTEECKLLPDWDQALGKLSEHVSEVMAEVKDDFWNSMGNEDQLPQWIDESVINHRDAGQDGANAIVDEVSNEIQNFISGADIDETFAMNMLGFDKWALAVYQDVGGFDHHCMVSSGFRFRYDGFNVMYDFASGEAEGYNSGDCQDSDARTQCECLQNMHDANVWCLNGGWYATFNSGGSFYQEYDGGARLVTPGFDNGGGGLRGKPSKHSSNFTLVVV
jgi:hypothetical protein